ncbi:transcription initiation factor IIA small subunit [Pochonia chlamydosporia 170]|uniref:Transcription initiation factor IIA subunit 2 n=1 Tax=Pochonia chlamydosporia 170 TaxID=1380566 RepID=A0A179G050_METCM|nr:transcription initiation factor IIA small subunit [Pochonia chlamydosporia 170]OAQ71274.2 transcription initiation factor IIA small subunit [Pochonia chlamydosporia 170]
MASGAQSFYELYRRSSIGLALTDTLDDLISEERINPQLAMKILGNFDQAITEALQKNVKSRLQFKGSLDTYRFCDEVWTFLIKNVTFKMDSGSQSVQADKVKISSNALVCYANPDSTRGSNSHSPNSPAASAPAPSNMVHQRRGKKTKTTTPMPQSPQGTTPRTQWMIYAIASGACAAFNGVFAKLTTTDLTSSLAHKLAALLSISHENIVEIVVRAIFFGLNLTFNGIMWTLFTKALARGTSTTQVSIINTSTNFMLTALLGLFIFAEALPPLWWAGASLLVVGNVIVGRKDEDKAPGEGEEVEREESTQQEETIPLMKEDEADEDVADLGDISR